MQNMILLLFALFFSLGLYLILAAVFKVPTYKATKAVLGAVKKNKKQAKNSDAIITELAAKLAKILPMDDYKRRRLTATLKSAEIPVTAEQYVAEAMVKAGLVFLCAIPCLLVVPIIAPAFMIIGIAVYFNESTKADKKITARREEIEYELPRFVATITQELAASRDVLSMIEHYKQNSGPVFSAELDVLTADMRSGSYEAALTRFEARFNSPLLSDIVRGLIGVLRGDNGVHYFQMLSHDMKQLELQRLKAKAMKIPPKIRVFSFVLLMCFLVTYLSIIIYEIIHSLGGMF